jgi:adenylate kinase family enzyme
MQRITVVGTPGAGKTTLAQTLAARLAMPFVELDALFWGPAWAPVGRDVFRGAVKSALAGERWAVGGNYSSARDIIWARSDTLVWLDYGLHVSMPRLLRRTLRRIVTREVLWAGNRESWRAHFASKDSLLLFALQTHHSRRRKLMHDLLLPAYRHLTIVRHRTPADTERWLLI